MTPGEILTQLLLIFVLLIFTTRPSSGSGDSVHKDAVMVKILNVAFLPGEITIKPGTTVRWVNLDPVPHDVTSGTAITGRRARQVKKTRFPDGKFHSGIYGKDNSFEITFKEKGRYHYFCNVHPIMQGVVTVW